MKKSEFQELDISDQVKYVEEKRANGELVEDISHSLGYIFKSDLTGIFKQKGYKYDLYTKRYVKYDSVAKLEPTNTENLLELLKYKSDILEMLQSYKSNINVIQNINIDDLPKEFQDNIVPKSIKVHEKVYGLFDELCDQYVSMKKQDLLSLALYEFYRKYKK